MPASLLSLLANKQPGQNSQQPRRFVCGITVDTCERCRATWRNNQRSLQGTSAQRENHHRRRMCGRRIVVLIRGRRSRHFSIGTNAPSSAGKKSGRFLCIVCREARADGSSPSPMSCTPGCAHRSQLRRASAGSRMAPTRPSRLHPRARMESRCRQPLEAMLKAALRRAQDGYWQER